MHIFTEGMQAIKRSSWFLHPVWWEHWELRHVPCNFRVHLLLLMGWCGLCSAVRQWMPFLQEEFLLLGRRGHATSLHWHIAAEKTNIILWCNSHLDTGLGWQHPSQTLLGLQRWNCFCLPSCPAVQSLKNFGCAHSPKSNLPRAHKSEILRGRHYEYILAI